MLAFWAVTSRKTNRVASQAFRTKMFAFWAEPETPIFSFCENDMNSDLCLSCRKLNANSFRNFDDEDSFRKISLLFKTRQRKPLPQLFFQD